MTLLRGMVGAFVLLAAWGLQLGAAPAAQAQQTCPAGQTYCPSGAYVGECRPNTATCTGGSYTACTGCVCDPGEVLCGTTCQAPKSCPDPNRSTSDQCAASDAASCGGCASGYTLDSGTTTCVLQSPVILAPLNTQERSSDKSTIDVVQSGSGSLLNLRAQSGADTATRKQIFTVDKTGLMVGYDPDAAKLGIDLSAAGGQNLLYAVARATGLDVALDSLLKLQVKEADGIIRDRFRIDGSGNVTAAGSVRGSQLCIGADCKSSWSAVAPAGVLLQGTTPGTQQTGNLNISGTARLGSLVFASGGVVNLQGGDVVKADTISAGATGATRPFIDFNNGFIDIAPSNASWGLLVKNSDPAVTGYAHLWHNGTKVILNDENSNASQGIQLDGSNLAVSGTLDVAAGIQAGSGNVDIVNATGKIPAISSTYFASLSGANLTSLNASNLASGTVPDARLPAGLLRNPIEGSASDGTTPWLTIQGGASALANVALRLYDAGTADGNINMLQFAHNGGSGPVLGAKIRSTNVGANAASGAKLTLETASNNTGTFNTNQLVLDRDGNVGVGLADPAVRLDVSGDVTATGDFTGKNTYECVNVGTELRCNLRQYWRTADKTSGYVESWIGSDTCTNICSRAGLRACTDIQFNYECPNGTLMQPWRDDDPGEFDPSERTCSSSEPYRATVSGITCSGQSGTEYKRYRCRCES